MTGINDATAKKYGEIVAILKEKERDFEPDEEKEKKVLSASMKF